MAALLPQHEEFRASVCGEAGELALPSVMQLLQTKPGLQCLLEFYTGVAPAGGTRVVSVGSVGEWKDALLAAGSNLVVAMFSTSTDVGCRILNPMFLRLPEANDGEFANGVTFVRVEVNGRADDGLALQVIANLIASSPHPEWYPSGFLGCFLKLRDRPHLLTLATRVRFLTRLACSTGQCPRLLSCTSASRGQRCASGATRALMWASWSHASARSHPTQQTRRSWTDPARRSDATVGGVREGAARMNPTENNHYRMHHPRPLTCGRP